MSPHLSSGQGWQNPGRRAHSQQDAGGNSMEENGMECQFFGDPLTPKTDNLFRVFLLNIGGLTNTKTHPKNEALKQILINHNVDVCCLTETNVHWKLMPPAEQLQSRFQFWF